MGTQVDWLASVGAASEAGRLAASVDWAATPLGPPDEWPLALRLAVETCLSTRFPMLVMWGSELVMIYNDGYRAMLGTHKHPGAMGSPVRQVWAEVAPAIEPFFRQVLDTGEATWVEDQLLVTDRNGFWEEAYFTYSYSPIRDEDGVVRGVLDTCAETTEQVVNARRLAVLAELRGHLVGATTVREACHEAMEVLRADTADLSGAAVHLVVDGDLVSSPDPLVAEAEVRRVLALGEAEHLGDLHLAPMGDAGVLVVRRNAVRPADDGFDSFVALASSALHMAVLDVRRHRAEVDQLRRTSETLQLAMLPTEPPQPEVASRYVPAGRDLHIGGDWFDVVELAGDRLGLVVGDCVGHGLAAATTMGQLRSAARVLLLQGHGPASVLEALDRFAEGVQGAESTTVLCAVVDRSGARVTYSSAGHPPGLVVDGERRWLDKALGVPLAVQPGPRTQAQATLPAGSTLVLYTDGLVERRTESLDDGFARLAALVAGVRDAEPEEVADRLLAGLVPDGTAEDDVALVVYRQVSCPAA